MARPRPTPEDEEPTPVECFVTELAEELGLDGSPSARRSRRQMVRLALWATEVGMPLDREVVFDPDTIERFAVVGLAQDRSRATHRAVLRRIGPLVTKDAPWEPRPASVARRQVAPPYSKTEVGLLCQDAAGQPTEKRRRSARAFLALGLGAGLDGRWVARVVPGDVRRGPDCVTVRVGDPSAREVVVLADWESEVLEVAASAGDDFLVGGRSVSRNRTGHLAQDLVVPTGHPRITPARLRSTWLVIHLASGTRLPELCRAAGLSGATVLSDLLAAIPPAAIGRATAMLRGASW